MEEKILTLHPTGKSGANISKAKYNQIRTAILETLEQHGEISFKDLNSEVENQLKGSFDGSISWYVTTVKLDLEARGEIERVLKKSPQHLRIAVI